MPEYGMTMDQSARQQEKFDGKGQIMRDIMSTTTAVELAISQERES